MRAYLESGSYEAARSAGIAAGEVDESGGFAGMMQILLKHPGHAALWAEHGAAIVEDWIAEYPGTRPWKWWDVSAPGPRRRLGGVGTPACEALAFAPSLAFGVPTHWVQPWDVEYYNGRARDVEGRPIGTEFRDGHFRGLAIDPADLPRYESQGAFLDRHGLLSAAERRALSPNAFEPETIRPADDEDDPRTDEEDDDGGHGS